MAHLTGNTTAFIESEQYSSFILEQLKDGLLPTVFYRDVSDFQTGETLHIKTIGRASLQEVTENTPLVYNAIDTGEVTLTITDYVGDAWFVTDKLRQDGAQIDQLMAARAADATRAIQENFETTWLASLNASQTPADANDVNGFAHRIVATGGTPPAPTLELEDLINMRLAFDKANVPTGGRVAIVDPVVAATLNTKFQGTYNVDSNQTMQNILEGGFARDHQFVMEIFGWNIMTSNRLPVIADETIGIQVTNGIANVFMSIADDHHKPGMVAWRQQPRVESERNKDLQRDEFVDTARWGVGPQRVDTLGIILTSSTAIA